MLNLLADVGSRIDAGQAELNARLDRIIQLLEQLIAAQDAHASAAVTPVPTRRRAASA